jgi:magnesium-transporting ATPase (P-type)
LLAIGDGANDVSMIQAAHVGVGISGVEVCFTYCEQEIVVDVRLGFTSCSVSRRGDFSVPLLEEAVAGTWLVELSTIIETYLV